MPERATLAVSAALVGAAIPGFIAVFALWGQHGLSQADAADAVKVLAFAREHPALYGALPVLGVVMHLAALLLVVGLHRRLSAASPLWVGAGSALGLSWALVDLVQNLMHWSIFLGPTPPEAAAAATRAADAVWHAGHFGGGAWVIMVGAAGGALFNRGYRAYSFVAGAVFLLHPFLLPLAPWWFGLEFVLVPIWAFWTAAAIARSPAFREAAPRAAAQPLFA